jgi:DNA repair protein RadD
MSLALFDYQDAAAAELRRAYARGCRAPLLVLPTGGGKTVVFTYITKCGAAKGTRVLLLAHRKELVAQISAALGRWDVPHGIISPDMPPTPHPVQVAMAQTLARRVKLDKSGRFKFDLVIVDEAHHATRDSIWGEILQHNEIHKSHGNGARLLGVTATPCRLDGKGLGVQADGFFDDIVIGPSVEELIRRGRLAPPVVYAPDKSVDLSGVKVRGGDYNQGQLAARMDQSALTGDAVEHYRRHCGGAPAIAFTVTVEHAGHVVEDFKKSGYQAAVLTGSTPDKERAAMIRDLGTGALHVLASCNVVSEGTDIPTVVAAIMLRPTASYALAMQQMGRALRACPGKDKAIILDHAGNSLRHGLPTEPVEWSLEGVKRNSRVELKPCYDCKAMIPARSRACPVCNKDFYPQRLTSPQVEQEALPLAQAGNLVELTPEKRAELRRWRRQAEQKARTLADFRAIGEACGYKPKWAEYRYNELRGRG